MDLNCNKNEIIFDKHCLKNKNDRFISDIKLDLNKFNKIIYNLDEHYDSITKSKILNNKRVNNSLHKYHQNYKNNIPF